MTRGYWLYGLVGVGAFLSGWVLFAELPEWGATRGTRPAIDASNSQIVEGALTEATLFYVSDDGMRLVGFSRSLERLAEPTAQARAILDAQLAPPPPPLLSPIPTGTRLLALYLTDRGEAFVDLSEEITLGHSGGSLEELFTGYAIVNALTSNLPAINAVQILVNGQEVDTLVGHVDLQRPLEGDLRWVAEPSARSMLGVGKLSRDSWHHSLGRKDPLCAGGLLMRCRNATSRPDPVNYSDFTTAANLTNTTPLS